MKKIYKIDVVQQNSRNKKLRVVAYCRVSTKCESQKTSIELQKEYYTKLIENNPDWQNSGVFVDYGSRCRMKGRPAFCEMIHKAMKGEIDYIITKSISRFSGNTVDMLKTIRRLEEKEVTVCFEKENLISTDERAELRITLYTALAQNEIRNMSENIKWGYTQRFMNGETPNNYKYFYGFYVENGELKINEEEAVVVRRIFDWYLEGKSLRQIKTQLEKEGIRTASGGSIWHENVIQGMLCNEKYAGDSMLQKTYTEDFLTGKRVKNIGQRDRYYVSNSHEGIVSKETFERVQIERESRKRVVQNEDGSTEVRKKYNAQNVLANVLVCGECGASFRRRTERGKVVYRCATRMEKGKAACDKSPTLEETWLKNELSKRVCEGTYDERVIREKVDVVKVIGSNKIEIVLKKDEIYNA